MTREMVEMSADELEKELDRAMDPPASSSFLGLTAQGDPWRVQATTVYIGGPIDLARGNPDYRHELLGVALLGAKVPAAIFCPFCDHREQGGDPTARVTLNRGFLLGSDFAVFEWDATGQPSIGVPIELWDRAHVVPGGRPSIVVGDLGDGIFSRYLVERGVVVLDSFEDAAAVVAGQETGS